MVFILFKFYFSIFTVNNALEMHLYNNQPKFECQLKSFVQAKETSQYKARAMFLLTFNLVQYTVKKFTS